jgi:XTP/dITP diphosphohydrolase
VGGVVAGIAEVQLTFLVTSPRVAPGLMSWPAWQAVSSADRVLASDDASPTARAVAGAGHRVDVLASPTVDDLLDAAASGHVVWLASDEETGRMSAELAGRVVRAGDELPVIEVLHASYDVPGARLLDLVTVMDRLRLNCPWDREQTHRSLARYLLEESYETLEAIESGDPDHLREELGDLLLQVYFHARIASESAEFDIDDVAAGIVDKLVHRHPHVFGGLDVADVAEVEANWETLKAAEKGRASVLDGIPLAMPALALAGKVLGRASRVGVDHVPGSGEVIGDRLLAVVAQARVDGVDAEQALRDAVRRLADSVRAAERASDQ